MGRGLRPCYTRQFFLQLATQRRRMKYHSSCRGGVTLLQLFSQVETHTITNKMADALSRRHLELWLAHSDKIALQVAEGTLHASNLSRNVAKSRGSFYFSCNSQRNNCSCKMGCYAWIFSCNLQRKVKFVALQIANIAFTLSATFSSKELDHKLTILATRVLWKVHEEILWWYLDKGPNVKLMYVSLPLYTECFYFTSDVIYQGIHNARGFLVPKWLQ